MNAYFPPHHPQPIPPSQHPLYQELTNTSIPTAELRSILLTSIQTEQISEKARDGQKTLEKFFLGKLMKQFRGKLNIPFAQQIIREEIQTHFEIIEPVKKGGYYIVKKR